MAPALLLPVLVLTTVRFGIAGLLGAAGAACLVLTALLSVQVHALRVLEWSDGAPLLAGTALLVVWTALPIAGSAHAAKLWRRWELDRWERDDANWRRLQDGLSEREWEVLQLIALDELTYRDIGTRLHISPETVKTHVRHIGEKLDGKGRQRVLRAAWKRQLLPPPVNDRTSTHLRGSSDSNVSSTQVDGFYPPQGITNPPTRG
jgi:DNA-binding CsgD family transcriptional regulator